MMISVKLKVNGKEYTRELVIKKDPNSAGKKEDIADQVKLLLKIREEMNTLVKMINRIEWTRKQLYDLIEVLKEEKDANPVIESARELDKKLMDIEENLFQMRLTGSRDDILRSLCQLHYKLSFLAFCIGQSDFPPTKHQVEVYEMFKEQIALYKSQLDQVIKKDLPDFEGLLKEKNIPHVISQVGGCLKTQLFASGGQGGLFL
jgi:DNA primase catalytic subunit